MAGRRGSFSERRERHAAVDDPDVILAAAARFLEARPRSIAEVRRRLSGAGYRTELVEGAISRLADLGMLDDEAFARAWVESRDRARPRGERALRAELALKGIDRATVDVVVEERDANAADGEGGSDLAAGERLLARHARTLDRIADPGDRRRRAYAILARNGFDPEVAAVLARTTAGD